LERDIFTVLQLVLGRGERDVPIPTDHRTRLDMRFRGRGGLLIGIEYDGAYWHSGREDADLRKAYRLLPTGTAAVVVRIRESPLRPTAYEDVCVGTGAGPVVFAIAALLHLIHIRAVDDDVETRVAAFLAAAAVKVDRRQIRCGRCRSMLRHLTLNLDRRV